VPVVLEAGDGKFGADVECSPNLNCFSSHLVTNVLKRLHELLQPPKGEHCWLGTVKIGALVDAPALGIALIRVSADIGAAMIGISALLPRRFFRLQHLWRRPLRVPDLVGCAMVSAPLESGVDQTLILEDFRAISNP